MHKYANLMYLGKTNNGDINLWFFTKSEIDGNKIFRIAVLWDDEALYQFTDYGDSESTFDSSIDFGNAETDTNDRSLSNFKITLYQDGIAFKEYLTNIYGRVDIIIPSLPCTVKMEKIGYESQEIIINDVLDPSPFVQLQYKDIIIL